MNIFSICFSPTGGTEKVSDILCNEFGEFTRIDLTDREADFGVYSFTEKDLCFISVPSYGGRVPAIALEHLGKMRAEGSLAVLVAVFGNRAIDDTLLELKECTDRIGFRTVAAVSAVAEHSVDRRFAEGRPDSRDREELCVFAEEIRKVVESGSAAPVKVPGNVPYRKYNGIPLKPHANSKRCTGCQLCAKRCPAGAIPMDDPTKTDKSKCISCMRCVCDCPVCARSTGKFMQFVASAALKKFCSGRKDNELFIG